MFNFTLGKPIYSKSLVKERNISLFFVIDFKYIESPTLYICGENEYQIYLNGNIIGYGPARAAHNYHRIDEYRLKNLKDNNRLLIILSGYNCVSFDRVKESPFIQYELIAKDKIIDYSSLSSNCYLNKNRYQKVARFSYQRNYTEAYHYLSDDDIFLFGKKLTNKIDDLFINKYGNYLSRNVSYPKLDKEGFSNIESGSISLDENKREYNSRFITMEELDIFKKDEWDINQIDYINKVILNKKNKTNILSNNSYSIYKLKSSKTGFINAKIKVNKKATLLLYFDEISSSENKIEINPFRNDTINIVYYELEKGEYNLTSFSPYTIQYLVILVKEGDVEIKNINLIKLENNDVKIKYQFDDLTINQIFEAAISTFIQNAVDILTDCPSRERAGWLCDSYFSARAELLITGENKVESNFLENYSHFSNNGLIDEGMIPMCYPSDCMEKTYIPNWAMFYVIELKDYLYRHSSFNNQNHLNNVISLVKFFKRYENEYNLLENLPSWVFVEWSKVNDKESIEGVNTASNALYVEFLRCASELLSDPALLEKSKIINDNIVKLTFDGHFYVDNLIRKNNKLVKSNRISETTQYYLFYFNIIDKKNNASLYLDLKDNYLLGQQTDSKINRSAVFIGDYFRLEILIRNKEYESVIKEVKPYFSKMATLTGTLWEHDNIKASLNHCFASFILNILFESITGIRIDYKNKIIYKTDTSYKDNYFLSVPLSDEWLDIKNGTILNVPSGYKFKNY